MRPRGKIRLAAALAVPALAASATLASGPGTPVTVIATGLKSAGGQLVLLAYDDEERWLTEEVHTGSILALEDSVPPDRAVRMEIRLPPGEYALLLFHDLDNDGQLRRNLLGIPREPLGLSGTASARFGPPVYGDALVTVADSPLEIRIELH